MALLRDWTTVAHAPVMFSWEVSRRAVAIGVEATVENSLPGQKNVSAAFSTVTQTLAPTLPGDASDNDAISVANKGAKP